ncbi:MAG: CoA transferase [Gammaproteobacteria bacterium]|jgi:crotonobetainyl-CoA:carnitine CoA-transferase CaiB-like acyl-CoA transferase|nr:CoA transferase [Gammaproteobacteria bacterium]MBT6572778.1 CoA transferase [Gammaproteobacteria bacterium]MBT6666643.1 CoA transferase [Gammaproteobacteria bacterium]MBT6949288.1 CoA transferase [Gammaproteobacteria bacterium]MBT7175116.1 CoA transferase [Gammaproteobacteria bacterium]
MGALSDIRIVDFGHYVAGPLTGMLLADQGATVIKVDPLGGPTFDSHANATWNRGKQSINLDLKSAADLDIAKRLIAQADVVIENFRPGVMDRLGLGAVAMTKVNPTLIYSAMPGFSNLDSRSTLQGWEGIVMAATDVFRPIADYRDMVQMLHRDLSTRIGEPVFTSEMIASGFAALISSLAITTAIFERNTSGVGQSVEVPLHDAMLQAVGVLAMTRPPFRAITKPIFSGFDHQYQCLDGRWVHIVATVPRHAEAFLNAVNRGDLIEKGLAKRGLATKTELNALLIQTLTDVFKTRTAFAWEGLFVELDIPGARCLSSQEWLDHPQATQSDLVVTIEDPLLGPSRQPGLQVKLLATPGEITSPAPTPNQHRDKILTELLALEQRDAVDRKQVDHQVNVDFPLAGLKVLDLCIILAGPTCGRSLAELGADVIKIDDPSRGGVLYHHDINRGKRSILIDLKTPGGLDVFWQLVDDADVIVQNYRSGVVEQLGIDYESIKARKPNVIYVSLNAFGDQGPWEYQPGYEEVVQALTGMQTRFGGNDRPILWPYGVVNDYGTGFAGAFGVVLALIVKASTGKGQHVTSALARTAGTLQSAHLIDYAEKKWDEPTGPYSRGASGFQRLYQCADGWLFLGASETSSIPEIVGLNDGEALEPAIERWCLARNLKDAVLELTTGKSAAHKLTWIEDFSSLKSNQDRGLIVTRPHAGIGELRTTGPGSWFSRSKIHIGTAASIAGSDAGAILEEVSRWDLDELVASNAIVLP